VILEGHKLSWSIHQINATALSPPGITSSTSQEGPFTSKQSACFPRCCFGCALIGRSRNGK